MRAVMDLFTRKPATVDYRAALDAEQLTPALAEAAERGRQMAERGRGFMAELEAVRARRDALVSAHGERALAAELAGAPLTAADLEAHERALEPMDREIRRLTGQVEAVLRAMPQQEAVITERRAEAAELVRARARELAGTLVAELHEAFQAIAAAVRQERELRHAERETLTALGHDRGTLPWILPAEWLALDERWVSQWAADMTAHGFDVEAR